MAHGGHGGGGGGGGGIEGITPKTGPITAASSLIVFGGALWFIRKHPVRSCAALPIAFVIALAIGPVLVTGASALGVVLAIFAGFWLAGDSKTKVPPRTSTTADAPAPAPRLYSHTRKDGLVVLSTIPPKGK